MLKERVRPSLGQRGFNTVGWVQEAITAISRAKRETAEWVGSLE